MTWTTPVRPGEADDDHHQNRVVTPSPPRCRPAPVGPTPTLVPEELPTVPWPEAPNDNLAANPETSPVFQLAHQLHQLMTYQPCRHALTEDGQPPCVLYRTRLLPSRAMLVADCTRQLARALDESPHPPPTESDCAGLQKDLTQSLPRLVRILLGTVGPRRDHTLRGVTLNHCVRIIQLASAWVPDMVHTFLPVLIQLLDHENMIPSDIRVDAACAMGLCVAHPGIDHFACTFLLTSVAPLLLSILCTAARTRQAPELARVVQALRGLGRFPPLSAKMARRRGFLQLVGSALLHSQVAIRRDAMHLCKLILVGNQSDMQSAPTLFESNVDLMMNALIQAAVKENEPHLQLELLHLLYGIVKSPSSNAHQVQVILQTLFNLTNGEGPEEVAIYAAVFFMKGIAKVTTTTNYLLASLPRIVTFLTSPFAKVRRTAFTIMNKLVATLQTEEIEQLLYQTDILESFSLILLHGCDVDRMDLLAVATRWAADLSHQMILCNHQLFLSALIKFVTENDDGGSSEHIPAAELLLQLLSNQENVPCFVKNPTILPWLASLANKTSDDEVKGRLVSGLVALSSALVEI